MASKLVRNERYKYAATFFNNLGVGTVAAAAIIPIIMRDEKLYDERSLVLAAGYILGLVFVAMAQVLLGSLEE